MADKTRSIHIEHSDGTATIVEDIPDSAKITFGPVQPGRQGYGSDNVLRIYTSQSNQLAVFRHVESFRDLSLSLKVREITSVMTAKEHVGPASSHSTSTRETNGRFVPVTVP